MDSKQAKHVIEKVREKQSQAPGSQHSFVADEGGPVDSSYRQRPPQGKTRPRLSVRTLPSKDKFPHDPREGTESPYHWQGKPTGAFKPQLQLPTPTEVRAPYARMAKKLPVPEKRSLDRADVFGPEIPASDVYHGVLAGGGIAGAKPLAKELATRTMSMKVSPKGGLKPKVAPKTILQSLMNVWKKKPSRQRTVKGAVIGGGLAAIVSSILQRLHPEKRGFAGVENMQNQLQEQLRGAALRDILGTALVGAGAAGTIRGGQGLWNLLGRSGSKLRSRSGIAPLPVPYRPSFVDEEEEEEKEAREKQAMGGAMLSKALTSALKRFAGGGIPWSRVSQFIQKGHKIDPKLFRGLVGAKGVVNQPTRGMLNQRQIAMNTLGSPAYREPAMTFGGRVVGRGQKIHRGAKSGAGEALYEGWGNKLGLDKWAFELPPQAPTKKSGLWWYMPAMLGAGAAGAYGGWKLIDSILDKRRRKEIEDEVDESRAGFQSALTSQYKEGSSSELGNALDDLYSKIQKQAGLNPSTWLSPDTKGQLLGSYATYAIPSALLGYMVVKGLADKGSRKKILEKAQRRRALKQQKARPAELYAVPTPIEEEEE